MKIAIDARMIKMSGIGTYIQNLMKNNCYDIALGRKEEIETVKNDIKTIEFDSPIYGIKEDTTKNIELENTADYDKLDAEIKKTNEFLMTLRELQSKLD